MLTQLDLQPAYRSAYLKCLIIAPRCRKCHKALRCNEQHAGSIARWIHNTSCIVTLSIGQRADAHSWGAPFRLSSPQEAHQTEMHAAMPTCCCLCELAFYVERDLLLWGCQHCLESKAVCFGRPITTMLGICLALPACLTPNSLHFVGGKSHNGAG